MFLRNRLKPGATEEVRREVSEPIVSATVAREPIAQASDPLTELKGRVHRLLVENMRQQMLDESSGPERIKEAIREGLDATLAAPDAPGGHRLLARAERDRLWALAHEDHLTGLPNRRRLDQALADALADMRARGSVLSVLLFDVDRFKDLNDRFGHATGDRVLREIAEVLRGNSRRQDVVGRFGGEEFLYLLPGHHLDEAVSQAERIRSELARHSFSTQNGEASLTVSVGATEASPDDRPEDVLERADRLLYQAKRSGRNRIVSLVS